MKLNRPKEKLSGQLPWVNDFSTRTVLIIGPAELLGAIGLIAPRITAIAPVITPVSAVGICLIMVVATSIVHMKKHEYKEMALNMSIFLLAAFVAYERF